MIKIEQIIAELRILEENIGEEKENTRLILRVAIQLLDEYRAKIMIESKAPYISKLEKDTRNKTIDECIQMFTGLAEMSGIGDIFIHRVEVKMEQLKEKSVDSSKLLIYN